MSADRTIVIIANPNSGHGRALHVARAVAEILYAREVDVTVRHTERPGDAERLAGEV